MVNTGFVASSPVSPINRQSAIVLFTTFLAFSTLYTVQPLLPLLVAAFDISMADAALLLTVTLIPMGIAPVAYGYFLQAIPAKTMLQIALLCLAINQIALFFAVEFWQLLGLRLLQGMILPAVFTALMTYCAKTAHPGQVRTMMGWYVASTIVGGCLSRAASGFLASHYHWQWIFLILGLGLLIPLWLTRQIDADAKINFERLDRHTINRVVKNQSYSRAYAVLFFSFFVFGGMLALLPFRLQVINPLITPFEISLIYFGYIAGIPASIFSNKLVQFAGSEKPVLLCGLAIVFVGVLGMIPAFERLTFAMMLPLAGGMFIIHSTLSGYVNHISAEPTSMNKGVVNGIYVSVYYISGMLGSLLPVILYQYSGWMSVIWVSITFLLLAFFMIIRIGNNPAAIPHD